MLSKNKVKESKRETASWPERYEVDKKGNEADRFMRAFLMIRSGEAGGSALMKKRLQKELLSYIEDLGLNLPEFPPELITEWRQFAKDFLESFAHSRSYGSTLFGMMQMKPEWVTEKLAQDLEIILFDYPRRFLLEDKFRILRNIFREEFIAMFPDYGEPWEGE